VVPRFPIRYARVGTERWKSGVLALEFEQAYDDNLERVYAFFAYRLNSRDDAEDLTQQTFERALRAWDRFDPRRAAVGTWLVAIARNLLIDHYRAAPPPESTMPLEAVPVNDLPAANGVIPGMGLEPDLARALGGLTQRDREILALRYGADLTGPEIVELTGLSLSNVQQILSRSLRRLREAIER
jgi:DNA-directed RNA polymerase specialized sigma24 family protein